MKMSVSTHNGNNATGLQLTGGSTTAEVDVTIGNGSDSLTTIAGDLSITTGLILDSVDITTIQTSSESFADRDTELMTSAAIADNIEAYGSYSYSYSHSYSYTCTHIFLLLHRTRR